MDTPVKKSQVDGVLCTLIIAIPKCQDKKKLKVSKLTSGKDVFRLVTSVGQRDNKSPRAESNLRPSDSTLWFSTKAIKKFKYEWSWHKEILLNRIKLPWLISEYFNIFGF